MHNPLIGAMVTGWGRCTLWEAAHKLADRLIYMDTDSMIFIQKPGDENLQILPELDEIGLLGGWTNEMQADDFIRVFAASGAKSYGYITDRGVHSSHAYACMHMNLPASPFCLSLLGDVKLKCKGVQQTSQASEILDMQVFKALILGDIQNLEQLYSRIQDPELRQCLIDRYKQEQDPACLILPDPQLVRDGRLGMVRSEPECTKRIKNTFDKRRLHPDMVFLSFPLGYRFSSNGIKEEHVD